MDMVITVIIRVLLSAVGCHIGTSTATNLATGSNIVFGHCDSNYDVHTLTLVELLMDGD